MARSGFDIVYTLKDYRAHHAIKNILGKMFHRVVSILVSDDQLKSDSRIRLYSILNRKVADAFLSCNDYHRDYLGILRWIGFKSTYLKIKHRVRPYGKSSYTFAKLVRVAVNAITSQTDRLLYLSVTVGLSAFIFSLLGAAYIVIAYFAHAFKAGWASIAVLILLCTGVILISLGTTAIYVGKIFEQSKGRPLYCVTQHINFSREQDAAAETRRIASHNQEVSASGRSTF